MTEEDRIGRSRSIKGIRVSAGREYIKEYNSENPDEIGECQLDDNYGITSWQLDLECDSEFYIDAWCRNGSPNAQAYHYLDSLDLGPRPIRSGIEFGGLTFQDGPCPGSNYLGVHADDKISLSCLQERLNQLGENIEIRLA